MAVFLQPWFEATVVHRFRAADFVPRPGVEVVLLRLRRREEPLVSPRDAALFGDFTAYDFTAWQPTVREVLARILSKRIVADIERALGVCLARSPSELQLSAWISLVDTFRTVAGERIAAVAGARERLERQQLQLQKRHRTRVSRG